MKVSKATTAPPERRRPQKLQSTAKKRLRALNQLPLFCHTHWFQSAPWININRRTVSLKAYKAHVGVSQLTTYFGQSVPALLWGLKQTF